jgi:hypothetical protein
MSSTISHTIKHRTTPKDVFYTPTAVAQRHISIVNQFADKDDVWLDPFKGQGVYYNNFPTENKQSGEITEGVDFFERTDPVNIICSNPPYSCLDKVIQHSISLNPTIISYLLGYGAMTPRRMKMLNDAGYTLKNIYITKVFKWYGMTEAYTFVRIHYDPVENNACKIEYDRIVHRPDA